jgi:predicted RNA-binding protein (virulence factor B family)
MRRAPEIGRFQTFEIEQVGPEGARLASSGAELLLPPEELDPDAQAGDRVRVFIYQDRTGVPCPTTARPAAALGGFATMRCVATTAAGAYLDWGLPKDLYVPPHEQAQRMHQGRDYVVVVCLDRKKERLIGSTHLASHFDYDVRSVLEDDEVELLVYGRTDAGIQVVVDQRHRGLVHHSDVYGAMKLGSSHTGYVRRIRDDNRLDIRLKKRGKAGMLDARDTVLQALQEAEGFLALHDRSSPAEIERRLGMSKKAFKKAVGLLYKARTIELRDEGIALAAAPDDDA